MYSYNNYYYYHVPSPLHPSQHPNRRVSLRPPRSSFVYTIGVCDCFFPRHSCASTKTRTSLLNNPYKTIKYTYECMDFPQQKTPYGFRCRYGFFLNNFTAKIWDVNSVRFIREKKTQKPTTRVTYPNPKSITLLDAQRQYVYSTDERRTPKTTFICIYYIYGKNRSTTCLQCACRFTF